MASGRYLGKYSALTLVFYTSMETLAEVTLNITLIWLKAQRVWQSEIENERQTVSHLVDRWSRVKQGDSFRHVLCSNLYPRWFSGSL